MLNRFVYLAGLSAVLLGLAACSLLSLIPGLMPTPVNSPAHRTFMVRQEMISMQPNIRVGDLLVVEEVPLAELRRGDVLFFTRPGNQEFQDMKRIIGLPGETVEIRDGKVYINGSALDEPYNPTAASMEFPPKTLKDNEYFVLGDNRNNSVDSRAYGPISGADIRGRVIMQK